MKTPHKVMLSAIAAALIAAIIASAVWAFLQEPAPTRPNACPLFNANKSGCLQ